MTANVMPSYAARSPASATDLVNAFLDRLDASAVQATQEQRRGIRLRYRLPQIRLRIRDSQGQWTTYNGPTRNISTHGLGVVLGTFAYPKTHCTFDLVSLYGHSTSHSGHVVRCRYLAGTPRLHEVGIQFDAPINVEMFCRQETHYKLLIVEPTQSTRVLIKALLQDAPLSCVSVDAATAMRALTEQHFDLALVTSPAGEAETSLVRKVRLSGFTTPLIAVLPPNEPQMGHHCVEAGFDLWIASPMQRSDLLCLIRSMRCEPIVSTLLHNPEKVGAIDDFARIARIAQRDLADICQSQDWPKLIIDAQMTQSHALVCGFPLIGAALQDLVETLQVPELDRAAVRVKLGFATRLLGSVMGASCKAEPGAFLPRPLNSNSPAQTPT